MTNVRFVRVPHPLAMTSVTFSQFVAKNWQRSGSTSFRAVLGIDSMKIKIAFLAMLLICAGIARADESIFAWTYTTDLLPKGRWEFEQWVTARWEKEHGTYNVFDFREEFEYGVTDNFQVSLYLNHHYVKASNSIAAENPAHPGRRLPGAFETGGEDVHAGHDPAIPFDSYHFESVSLELIYRLLSPYKHPFGLALYFEPAVGDQETELEWKILLQKNWFEDRLVWALNVNYELEYEKEEDGDGNAMECSNGLPDSPIVSRQAGQLVSNSGIITNSPMPLCMSIRPIFSDRHSTMADNVGGLRSDFFTSCRLVRLSVRATKNSRRHDGYIFGDEHEKYYVRLKVGFNF